MDDSQTQDRWNWIRSLKVGDEVLDCRDQRRVIRSIEDQYRTSDGAGMMVLGSLMLGATFATFVNNIAQACGCRELTERIVTFDNGQRCQATACLDPIPNG